MADTAPQTISEMLARARQKLDALKNTDARASKPGRLATAALVLVVVLAAAGLVVHTFFEDGGPKVDGTTVALLAVLMIAPFVPRLKALELGGAKAQWQENAAASIAEVIEVLEHQHNALDRLYQESLAQTPARRPVGITAEPASGARRHVLWVDDRPADHSYERQALSRFATVTTVPDTAAVAVPDTVDAVVSGIGDHAEELLESVPDKPVVFYGSPEAVAERGAVLMGKGAAAVTALPGDLAAALRAA